MAGVTIVDAEVSEWRGNWIVSGAWRELQMSESGCVQSLLSFAQLQV